METVAMTRAGEPSGVGSPAPQFTLDCAPGQPLSLASLRGRPVVLVFYPADWSPVCTDQLALYNQVLAMFERHEAQLLGISVDSVWCHQAFREAGRIAIPLLADFEPKGQVSRQYGVYDRQVGYARRALFVIDRHGVIAWKFEAPVDVNPGADGILDALEALESGR